MSQKLYEEALADARKVTEVAENNAKQAVLEAVLPRIRKLIETELLSENPAVTGVDDDEELLLGDQQPHALGDEPFGDEDEEVPADAISTPDEEGKVTLDLDSLCPADDYAEVDAPTFGEPISTEDEYDLSVGDPTTLEANTIENSSQLYERMKVAAETIRRMQRSGRLVRESKGFLGQITRMISRVENMYEYVQESVEDPAKKEAYESKLENFFQALTRLQETAMSKKNNKLNEEDQMTDDLDLDVGADDGAGADDDGELTLKLTGLPDDVDLDDVGVDLVADDGADDEDVGDDDVDVDLDVDMADDDEGGDQVTDQLEVTRLSDDTIVEIDENMLRREIKKMREAHSAETDANGHGQDSASMDDFGGASSEGEPLDVDVETDGAEPLGEADEMPEVMDEYDDMAETDVDIPMESIKRKVTFEKKVQERAKARAASLKKEARRASGKKLFLLKREYSKVAKRFNESVKRTAALKKQLNEARSNSTSTQQADKAAQKLRSKLSEANLNNVKLAYANKTLQSESLTKRQKAQVIRKLDDAKTVREAKLVYESVAKAVGNRRRRSLKENRHLGTSSRATRPAQTQTLNEGFETERWSKLAGITK